MLITLISIRKSIVSWYTLKGHMKCIIRCTPEFMVKLSYIHNYNYEATGIVASS